MRNARAKLDGYDKAILDVVSTNGRISIADLARRIGLSKSPTQTRLRRLESEQIISGYRALIDPVRMGLEHVAFVEVRLSDTREAALAAFNAAVTQIAEIEQVHMIAGRFDYLMKIKTQSMAAYRIVLAEKISTLPFVAGTSTYVAMQAVKEDGLPVHLNAGA